jgi:hypothetical protein
MTVKTRKQVRQQLATDLSTALTGAGNPAQIVYNHLKGSFDESPALCVASVSMEQTDLVFGTGDDTDAARYGYELMVFVDRDPDAAYDEENAEDALDEMAQGIYEFIEDNTTKAGWWQRLTRTGPSNVIPGTVGRAVWIEIHPITLEVMPGA